MGKEDIEENSEEEVSENDSEEVLEESEDFIDEEEDFIPSTQILDSSPILEQEIQPVENLDEERNYNTFEPGFEKKKRRV